MNHRGQASLGEHLIEQASNYNSKEHGIKQIVGEKLRRCEDAEGLLNFQERALLKTLKASMT